MVIAESALACSVEDLMFNVEVANSRNVAKEFFRV